MAEQTTAVETTRRDSLTYKSMGVVAYTNEIFQSFRTSRLPHEDLWMEALYNFYGQYQPERRWRPRVEGKDTHRSRIFVKLTQLKCHTAHAKIYDALFAGSVSKVPFDCEPINPESFGIPLEMAKQAALKFKQKLSDHFKYIDLEETYDTGILEMAILGSSVLKGPLIETRRRPVARKRKIAGMDASDYDAAIDPFALDEEEEQVATIDNPPLWEIYFDCNAKRLSDSIGVIHYRRLLKAEFQNFLYGGGYDRTAVKYALETASTADPYDMRREQLGDMYTGEQSPKDNRVSVMEYWGSAPALYLREAGAQVPQGVPDDQLVESLIVVAGGSYPIKVMTSPLRNRPFYVCPFKKKPHQIYGSGVAEMMRDSQKMVNSAARILIDNKAISGNAMTAVNLNRIDTKRTADLKVYPGKTWYVKGNFTPREAVDNVVFPDVSQGLRELIEMFERFSDEETGIPKYTHGEQDSFLNKTAHGMSMLMTQANINLKSVLRNIDKNWTEKIVEAFYFWFMEMDADRSMKVPLRMKATGSDSMIAKELKMENYMKFLKITEQPQDAIIMDRPKLMRSIAQILEIDTVRSEEEVNQILQKMSQEGGQEGKDIKELIAIDRLYPALTRKEQMQVLLMLGINPDPEGIPQDQVKDAKSGVLKIAEKAAAPSPVMSRSKNGAK